MCGFESVRLALIRGGLEGLCPSRKSFCTGAGTEDARGGFASDPTICGSGIIALFSAEYPGGKPMSVVIFGSINMDLVVRTPRLPAPGETLTGHTFFTASGGK